MSLYVDTSALLKLSIKERESDACEAWLASDPDWITARHTLIETRRNLYRLRVALRDGVEAGSAPTTAAGRRHLLCSRRVGAAESTAAPRLGRLSVCRQATDTSHLDLHETRENIGRLVTVVHEQYLEVREAVGVPKATRDRIRGRGICTPGVRRPPAQVAAGHPTAASAQRCNRARSDTAGCTTTTRHDPSGR